MLMANQLTGFGADGSRPGPYSMSYAGLNFSSGTTRTISFNIGPQYDDRIVFIGAVSGTDQSITSCSVNGAACTKIFPTDQILSYSHREFWYVVAPPGENSVSITVNYAISTSSLFAVWVLGGGAGLNPTFDVISQANNNDNSITTYFNTPGAVNDFALVIGYKPSASVGAFDGFSTNLDNLNTSFVGTSFGNGGCGGAFIGPNITYQASAFITTFGSDSSKAINMAAIKFAKAL